MRKGVLCAVLAAAAVLTTCAASAQPGPPPTAQPSLRSTPFVVGVDDDLVKWLGRPNGVLAKYRDLGVGAVRVTIPWHRGMTKPTRLVGTYLSRSASLVAHGQQVVLAVFGPASQAPIDAQSQTQYCEFLHHVLLHVPFRDVVVWNEANSPRFWPQSADAGAPAYEALLAACWTRLHFLRGARVNVISTTAAHYDPAGFIRAVGAAYRASGRRSPIIDTFGHNPYPDSASEPPWVEHGDPATVGEGDLDRLLSAIHDAFDGTAQPEPGTGRTTVWYLEDGFQTSVPDSKRRLYHGVETDPGVVPALLTGGSDPGERDQARQIRDALYLARCQPTVGAYFNFELLDEDRLSGWQSGLLWRDGTEKPSYRAFKAAAAAVTGGDVDCSTVPGAGGPLPAAPADDVGSRPR